jgi:uncharacterized protein YecE (DUF72 family)
VAELRIGTSGWIYRHWREIFYPEKLPQRSWFEHYARHFDTVEVNFTFYRLPERSVFERWREAAAADFKYAVKGSRVVTHVRRLREPVEGLTRLAERLEGLGERAGPVLWQLPPDFPRDDGRLAAFLEALPPRWRHTLEFRHESWYDQAVYSQLERHGVALCIPDSPKLPQALRLTADWTYIRFHGAGPDGDYSPELLDLWAERIGAFLAGGADVWAYFNNDWHGFALRNARDLRERLGARPERLAESA